MKTITKENIKAAVDASIAVVYQKFTACCKEENKDKLFCFFEGKDASYYSYRVELVFKEKYLNFFCKNKANVVKMYKKIHLKKSDYLLAFFIDRDFDEPNTNQDIYETPTYSIENLYCNCATLAKILKNEFYINTVDDEYEPIMDLFKRELDDYSNKILLFNSWYHSLKKRKILEGLESTNVSLDDKIPNDFLDLKIGNITSFYTLDKIKEKYKSAIEVSEEEINNSKQILLSKGLPNSLRGKFMLNFLIEFCSYLCADSKREKVFIKQNINFHTDKVIALSHLKSYAVTPECLMDYLNSFIKTSA
ncbi:DUF4435 domain-containing protein [Sphingobacterium paramultivorum]|uniref:DUF4435 domain-containing protein n=1 Tax=Sphingobacterium paramultivorum TaxID=2886510 RepID=A0A7G5E1Q7_9SPHI|nr:DUF4435 domain-containing protein [Sphingobacterium paramultivorum]QMV67932.1 DUF4435 domain-containing protein [Sphingobacterium paramultivorum]WSO16832.1 DUF4435 domain-containing protein [Sphingobacterium paramultivorum]